MHESKRWRLICYDIRSPVRYRKAHQRIKGYGESVQYSMFRCHLDDRQTAELRWELSRILTEDDSLLIVDLCLSCAGRVVTCNHKAGWDEPPPTFAVARSKDDQAPARAPGKKAKDDDKV